ncbi:MAG: hypothetical protein N838_17360 [Thiohalocapsa sp. PB-PSB1]|nr:MAG: hypothetical protein N838_17360 [Thiohalocapsa sp. PB-PSB1]
MTDSVPQARRRSMQIAQQALVEKAQAPIASTSFPGDCLTLATGQQLHQPGAHAASLPVTIRLLIKD